MFADLALELYELHRNHNACYDRHCRRRQVGAVARWQDIPALPAVAFKEEEVTCLPTAWRSHEFRSSGTTARRQARHFHHGLSLQLYEASAWNWFHACCGRGLGKHRCIFLTPSPAQAPHSSLVHMFAALQRHLPDGSSFFAGEVAGDSELWEVNLEVLLALLGEAETQNRPVALFGAGFHYVHLLERLAERGLRLALPQGSWALETGGYKGRSRVLARTDLHDGIAQRLGISPSQVISEYGMCELSSQAYDQAPLSETGAPGTDRRLFRLPPWARARIFSPETNREAAPGEAGLICVLDLANAWSVLAVQTEDLGRQEGEGFLLLGRVPQADPRGCSLQVL